MKLLYLPKNVVLNEIILNVQYQVYHVFVVSSILSTFLSTDSRIQEQRCFAADSLVTLADGTQKSIAHLHPGDSLLAYDDHSKQLTTTSLLTMLDFQPHHFGRFFSFTLSTYLR